MPLRGATIAESYADWSGPRQPEEDIFGTGDPERIAMLVDGFCTRSLGAGIERYEFFSSGVQSVHGVRLLDGRLVVVKAARRSFGAGFLAAAHKVQAHLAAREFPCPEPILAPAVLERGIAVVEEMVCRGARADAHDPAIRSEMARMLARQVDLARGFVSLEGLGRVCLPRRGRGRRRPRRCGPSRTRRGLTSRQARSGPNGSTCSRAPPAGGSWTRSAIG